MLLSRGFYKLSITLNKTITPKKMNQTLWNCFQLDEEEEEERKGQGVRRSEEGVKGWAGEIKILGEWKLKMQQKRI